MLERYMCYINRPLWVQNKIREALSYKHANKSYYVCDMGTQADYVSKAGLSSKLRLVLLSN